MGKKKAPKLAMSIKLVKSMLNSIYKDADKGMYVCETLKGTPLLIPTRVTAREMFDIVWRTNRAEGTCIKTSGTIQRAPKQLGFAFEGTQPNPV